MADPPRTILLIDANAADCTAMQRALEHDSVAAYTCITAPTAAAAQALCRDRLPDAIVLNDNLPDRDGLALLADLVGAHGEHACAIILLVAADNLARAARALKLGAHDYIVGGSKLTYSLGRAVASAIAQVDLRRQNAALLRELAESDPQRRTRVVEHPQAPFSQTVLNIERKRAEEALRDSRQQLLELSVRLVNAQEDERRMLAHELHDEIGQQLTGLNMVLESDTRAPEAQLRAKLHEAQQLIAGLTGQVRRLSLDLRPPMLDDLGLLPTLLWHIQRYTQQTGVLVDFKYHDLAAELPPHVAITAYRIVQEGLTNIARHAQTATAAVRMWMSAGQLKVTIEDQGCGFDMDATSLVWQSVGLAGMRERAQLLGGQFTLDSTPGEGTRIRVTLPIGTAGILQTLYR